MSLQSWAIYQILYICKERNPPGVMDTSVNILTTSKVMSLIFNAYQPFSLFSCTALPNPTSKKSAHGRWVYTVSVVEGLPWLTSNHIVHIPDVLTDSHSRSELGKKQVLKELNSMLMSVFTFNFLVAIPCDSSPCCLWMTRCVYGFSWGPFADVRSSVQYWRSLSC